MDPPCYQVRTFTRSSANGRTSQGVSTRRRDEPGGMDQGHEWKRRGCRALWPDPNRYEPCNDRCDEHQEERGKERGHHLDRDTDHESRGEEVADAYGVTGDQALDDLQSGEASYLDGEEPRQCVGEDLTLARPCLRRQPLRDERPEPHGDRGDRESGGGGPIPMTRARKKVGPGMRVWGGKNVCQPVRAQHRCQCDQCQG